MNYIEIVLISGILLCSWCAMQDYAFHCFESSIWNSPDPLFSSSVLCCCCDCFCFLPLWFTKLSMLNAYYCHLFLKQKKCWTMQSAHSTPNRAYANCSFISSWITSYSCIIFIHTYNWLNLLWTGHAYQLFYSHPSLVFIPVWPQENVGTKIWSHN